MRQDKKSTSNLRKLDRRTSVIMLVILSLGTFWVLKGVNVLITSLRGMASMMALQKVESILTGLCPCNPRSPQRQGY
ncbi:hypothetical protein MTBMA_c08160 [Methanothermobacter marburgensis str. Marburg]|uniref:Uncharacterized protein n=1 Tax=Methanothermobacter marburgensis (strain ATCC BAA-927 / DSM 2133 / JCM 14651 / NBRC 100331 / OCM 82 / Marburg) TaxID=79929 RepID=D9PW13_METTM|nr:hypothetical protein MTBMA_c08160 [Methanothermobacter marburgensis str. Marburg]